MPNFDVSVTPCADYSEAEVTRALDEALSAVGGLDWVKQGMTVAIKANLVVFFKPERAATTHPSLLCALVKRLHERGAKIILGDSPGGLYNAAFVNRVYAATGMSIVEKAGATLNNNFSQVTVEHPSAKIAKHFTYTAYLDEADAIINFCKLKSHGMMGMSAAAKNMFGTVPGTMKPEYHFKYPDPADFADMLIDIDEYFADKMRLCIVDAVVGMEGNGPTQGTPKQIGAVLAGTNPHKVDLACATIIGASTDSVPTLAAAINRGLTPDSVDKLAVSGDLSQFIVPDFDRVDASVAALHFSGNGAFARLRGAFLHACLQSKPKLTAKECVGCNECGRICPAKAIVMKNGKAVIDRKKCIKCFCCQEFCPKGAMKVGRTLIAKLLNK